MTRQEVEAIGLQDGDPIQVYVRFRKDPYAGIFLQVDNLPLTWRTGVVTQAKSLEEVLRIEKLG
jgi:hypothetical protein